MVLSVWLVGPTLAAAIREGAETRVNADADHDQYDPRAACGPSGDCLVAWYQRVSPPAPNGVFGRFLDRAGRPKGADVQINAYLNGDHLNPAIAADAKGNFIVAWEGETENLGAWEVRARRFARDGTPLTGDLVVSTSLVGSSYTPAVAAAPDGRFVVAWSAYPGDGDGSALFVGRFDATGAPVGAPFIANTTAPNNQDFAAVAMDDAGGFFVVWDSYGQDGDADGIFGRRYDATGAPVTGEIAITTTTAGYQSLPSIVRDASGDFLVTWDSDNVDGSNSAAIVRRFDTSGTPITGEIVVNQTTQGYQWGTCVAAARSGAAVVSWTSENQGGDGGTIVARGLTKSGVPSGAEFQVNSTTAGYQYYGRVATDAAGNFVVAWTGPDPTTSSYEIWSQRYSNEKQVNAFTADAQREPKLGTDGSGRFIVAWDSFGQDGQWEGVFAGAKETDGTTLAPEFQVNTYTAVGQYQPAMTSNTNGGFVVVWSSAYQDGSGYGVFGQRFDAAGARVGSEFQVNTTTEGYQETPAVARRTQGDFVVVWSSYGQDGSS